MTSNDPVWSRLPRRSFLQRSVLATTVGSLPVVAPPSVLGANDRINLALIGAGNRGRGLLNEFQKHNTRFLSVCDVYSPHREQALEAAGHGATGTVAYQESLERSDVDAVVIATPEHQHGKQLIDAVHAGKDVYCEKPMSHSIEEGNRIVEAVRDSGRIVQIGLQRRSSPAVQAASEYVAAGNLGAIHSVRAEWNWNVARPLQAGAIQGELDWDRFCSPSPVVPVDPVRFFHWRVFWDYSGGHNCDQGTHLMDVVQWCMQSGTPRIAECFGDVYKTAGAQTPDVFTAMLRYETFVATWSLTYTNRFQNGWSILFLGDQGTLKLDGTGSRFWKEPWNEGQDPDWTVQGQLSTRLHVLNFIQCVASRNRPNAPVEIGHASVCGPHLANVAYHNKRRAFLNPEATAVSFD